jgi:hypothetical protein
MVREIENDGHSLRQRRSSPPHANGAARLSLGIDLHITGHVREEQAMEIKQKN